MNLNSEYDQIFERVQSEKIHSSNESVMTNSNILSYLDSSLLSQEIFFRYSHEANKIFFCLETIRKTCDFLHKNQISKSLLFFICIFLVKTKHICKSLVKSLVNRENIFKINRFNVFLKSHQYEKIIWKLKKVLNKVRIMEKKLKSTHRFSYFMQDYKLNKYFGIDYKETEYKKMINVQLLYIIREKIFAKQKKNAKNIRYCL